MQQWPTLKGSQPKQILDDIKTFIQVDNDALIKAKSGTGVGNGSGGGSGSSGGMWLRNGISDNYSFCN